ncbi:carboxy terminal-processing peptidase [Pendulispora brunnea]|uniref:Carboxy terminal-processing peptidase n=1 Tax=Pendulispora brunnea TaxID=2905690 RepID=A0ABZ2KFP6_9BACT
MRRSIALFALLFSCRSPDAPDAGIAPPPAASQARPTDRELPETPRDPREAVLADAAINLLSEHVLGKPIDDATSKDAFERMVEDLDAAKIFLLEGDVQRLARFETEMDDELRSGDLALGRKAAALLASRRRVVADIIAGILAKPLDFTANESIETDPKKRAFCKSEEELTARWRGELKLRVLERTQELEEILEKRTQPKVNGKAPDPDDAKRDAAAEKALGDIPPTFEGRRDKVQKELATRFATQFTRLAAVDKLAPAATFINAVNGAFDPHTDYLPPAEEAELDIALTGRLEGIGATLREQEHYILVNDLVPGGAAWQQGNLEVGDLIMAVTQEGKAPVDVMDMPIGKVVSMIRGPKGTVVILTVKKADGSVKTISITRDIVRIEATYARGAILKTKGSGEIGYVNLPGFYGESKTPGERNATDDMRTILTQLTKKGVTSLVFDLRGNGGGLLTQARDVAGLFVKEGPIVQTKVGSGKVEVLRDTDPSIAFNGNVVVLVDRFCASAAEIVAGALQDYERAVVVGTGATHGKGTVQVVIDLDRQSKVKGDPLGLYKVTVQEYFRVSGGSTQLKGVVPDILLPDPMSFVESGERKLPHAIPWSTIGPAPFVKVQHAWKAPDLASASATRTSSNVDLATVSRLANVMAARKDQTLKPLERTAWQAEYKRTRADLDALDPKKHQPKPLMEVVPLTPQTSSDPRLQRHLDKWKGTLASDLWVDETTHILADMKKAH